MEHIPATTETIYDIAIIGGGINGTAIARDAALRGLNVYLCEKDDLASATSSASSKIAHGGLRYLETYEFSMVRKALREREVLLNIAPHLVTPMAFIIPHAKHLRPRWLIRLGLFIYDHLYLSKRIAKARSTTFHGTSAGRPLKSSYKKGFIYGDGWADDARLVVLNALDAAEHGATIMPRTACTQASHDGKAWQVSTLSRQPDGTEVEHVVRARALINAAGPWAEKFLNGANLGRESKPLTLVKGSHIVVPKMFDHQNAYTLQTEDGRVLFMFPYEGQFTLIGTTDTPHEGDPAEAHADPDEIDYMCGVVNHYFREQISAQDVVWSYSGVRPLIDSGDGNASKASRDYSLKLSENLPLLNIWGGKLTSHRQLAEDAVAKLQKVLGKLPPCTTAGTPLPGGDVKPENMSRLVGQLQREQPWLQAGTAKRLVHAYGTRALGIFENVSSREGLGHDFGGGLYQPEVDYLIDHEWAQTAEDILWRRSKMGLHTSLANQTALKDYVKEKLRARTNG